MTTDTNWCFAVDAKEVVEDGVIEATVNGASIAIYKLGDDVYATSNICTHGNAFLSDGYVEGDTIECPLHQGKFHIPTGSPCGAPVEKAIQSYPAEVREGKVFILISIDSEGGAGNRGGCGA